MEENGSVECFLIEVTIRNGTDSNADLLENKKKLCRPQEGKERRFILSRIISLQLSDLAAGWNPLSEQCAAATWREQHGTASVDFAERILHVFIGFTGASFWSHDKKKKTS